MPVAVVACGTETLGCGRAALTGCVSCCSTVMTKVENARQQCAQQLSENDMVMKACACVTLATARSHGGLTHLAHVDDLSL